MSAHHIIINIGMGIIPEAGSKYPRKQIAATAIKYNSRMAATSIQFKEISSCNLKF